MYYIYYVSNVSSFKVCIVNYFLLNSSTFIFSFIFSLYSLFALNVTCIPYRLCIIKMHFHSIFSFNLNSLVTLSLD